MNGLLTQSCASPPLPHHCGWASVGLRTGLTIIASADSRVSGKLASSSSSSAPLGDFHRLSRPSQERPALCSSQTQPPAPPSLPLSQGGRLFAQCVATRPTAQPSPMQFPLPGVPALTSTQHPDLSKSTPCTFCFIFLFPQASRCPSLNLTYSGNSR